MSKELFGYPAIYDIAFQFRYVRETIDFIEDCARMYTEIPVRSVVDIACGTGHYTCEFAGRDYVTYGVDLDAAACEYARRKATASAVDVEVICANMIDFTLPQPCDLAVNFFDSLTYVTDRRELVTHFSTVARALTPGGVYIVELGVVDQFENHNVEEVWTEHRRGMVVTSTYFRDGAINPATNTFKEHCSFRATYQQHSAFFSLNFTKRALYFDEFLDIVKASGAFTPLVFYDEFLPDAFLSKDELPWRVIAVLRRD